MNIGTEFNGLTYIVKDNQLLVLNNRDWNNVVKSIYLPYGENMEATVHVNEKVIVVELKVILEHTYPVILVYQNDDTYKLLNTITPVQPWYGDNYSSCALYNNRLSTVIRSKSPRLNNVLKVIDINTLEEYKDIDIVGSTDYVSILKVKEMTHVLVCNGGIYEILKYSYNTRVSKHTFTLKESLHISNMGGHRLEAIGEHSIMVVNIGNTIHTRTLGDIYYSGVTKTTVILDNDVTRDIEYIVRNTEYISRHSGDGKEITRTKIMS